MFTRHQSTGANARQKVYKEYIDLLLTMSKTFRDLLTLPQFKTINNTKHPMHLPKIFRNNQKKCDAPSISQKIFGKRNPNVS